MNIVKVPDEILKRTLAPITADDLKKGAFDGLADQMRAAMKDHNGVGLAANQVGQDIQLFVIDAELAKEHGLPDAFANPEIIEYSKEFDEMEEGCLSIPRFYVPIARAKKIQFKALDLRGKKIRIRARGFLARVLQHETDHLNGTTINERTRV